jgi:hypothetical protein
MGMRPKKDFRKFSALLQYTPGCFRPAPGDGVMLLSSHDLTILSTVRYAGESTAHGKLRIEKIFPFKFHPGFSAEKDAALNL